MTEVRREIELSDLIGDDRDQTKHIETDLFSGFTHEASTHHGLY